MAAEITKKKLHIGIVKKGKTKFETRYATLTADSLTFYKKQNEPYGSELIPTEKILTAEQKGEKKGKHMIQISIDKDDPLLVATDTQIECDIWTNELKRCKARKDLNQWLIKPDSIILEREIGAGAFGTVWKGKMSGTPVAVKEMRQGVEDDEIEKEIHLLSKIRNPYCVRLLGIYRNEQESKLFIVTEFVEGGDLSDALYKHDGRAIPEDIKLRILRDCARGISFLHENNIIHRDLKTDNCLLRSLAPGSPQHAVVADFGISKLAPNLGEAGSFQTVGVGTPVYMAPECFKKTYTSKLDVYSFGVMMNEVFSVERPWSHIQTQWNAEIHNRVDRGERPRFNFTPQELPHYNEIVRIINAAWTGDPNKRPTMHEILNDLETLIASSEGSAPPQIATGRNVPYYSVPAASPAGNPAGGQQYATAGGFVRAHIPNGPQNLSTGSIQRGASTGGFQPPVLQTAVSTPYMSTPGANAPYLSATPAANPYGNPYGNPYASTGGVGNNPYISTAGGGNNPYISTAGGGNNPYVSTAGANFHPPPVHPEYYDDVAAKIVSFIQGCGGCVSTQQLSDYLNQFTSPRDAQQFADLLSQMFHKGNPVGAVIAECVLSMKQWFFPIAPEKAQSLYEDESTPVLYEAAEPIYEGGGSIYEGGPQSNTTYEGPGSGQPTTPGAWHISNILAVCRANYFKGFMDANATIKLLKTRGTSPGQYVVRFSSSEPGKLAISVLDNSMQVRHWKVTLLPGGRAQEAPTLEHNSIQDWLAYHKDVAFPYQNGSVKLTIPCP